MRIRHAFLVLVAVVFSTGCLSISQEPCEPLAAMCIDGDVWVCRVDGSGWDPEMACPQGLCSEGRCALEPLPSIDVYPQGIDSNARNSDQGS